MRDLERFENKKKIQDIASASKNKQPGIDQALHIIVLLIESGHLYVNPEVDK